MKGLAFAQFVVACCVMAHAHFASCNVDDGEGQQMVWVSSCEGHGCRANGIDNDCAWCVYDMAKCEVVHGAACRKVLAARQRQQAPCSYASGQGAWRYRYAFDLLSLPTAEVHNDENGHGLTQGSDGNIYFTFVPKKVTKDTQVLVRFSPDGTTASTLGERGPEGLSAGVPHGLRIEEDTHTGQAYLYHANNAQKVIKTNLDGAVVWVADFSHWKKEKPEYWPIAPTDTVVVPGTDILLVADGYGSSFIHALNKTSGAYLENRTFGGLGNTTKPLRFNTPHAISIDARMPGTFVVSDRSNSRLVWVTAEGKFVKAVPTVHPLPCNVHVHQDPVKGQVAAVPSLGHGYTNLTNGCVEIYDQSNSLLSTIEVAETIGYLGHQHPHDAIFLPNGDIVVCCWAGPANPGQGPAKGTISYWRREPQSCTVDDEDTDYVGDDIKVGERSHSLSADSVEDCCNICQQTPHCTHWSWNAGLKLCFPKTGKGTPTAKHGDRSGSIHAAASSAYTPALLETTIV